MSVDPKHREGFLEIPKGSFAASYSIQIRVSGLALNETAAVNKYPAKEHARRVAGQLRVRDGLIYLMGQRTREVEDSDMEVPFRQRRYFSYLSGVEEPDCHLTYDVRNDVLTLYVPDFDLRRAIWMGPTLGKEEARDKYDADEVKYYSDLQGDIKHWASKYNSHFPVYILHRDQKPALDNFNLWTESQKLLPAMNACRVIKDSFEIDLIRSANRVSASAHTAVLQGIRKMSNEAEIYATFLDTSITHGSRHQSYPVIAASGENASTLHYTQNNQPLKGRQFVCLDAGAEWNCYASDVTRTFPLSDSWPSKEAWKTYAAVQRMQESCISRICEGVRFIDLHWLAHDIAIEELLDLGVFKPGYSVDEIRQSGASSIFFPHGLGHHVGLEVHDVSAESLMAANQTEKSSGKDTLYRDLAIPESFRPPCTVSAPALQAGMVVTVEPGIYFSRLALEDVRSKPSLSKYIDIEVARKYIPVGGVRIEDDILVTKEGFVNLTTAPKGQAMLDIIRRGSD